ncbi:MAG TPA: hypothetical protein ENK09_07370 [Nitrospirae bacterium]|nr:hypothetical protein [Nitrospirota bacterium]
MIKKTIGVSALVFVILVVAVYFMAKSFIFASPKNCTSCHYMVPFYNKWKTSTHNKVPCLKCHDYTPLNAISGQLRFLVGTYNPRPLTNVPDKNCLQTNCHEKRLIESKVTFTKWNIGFDHKPHFKSLRRGIKLHCRSCHSDIVQGEHVKVSKNPCFLCHFMGVPEGQAWTGCPSCHTSPKEDIPYQGRRFSHKKAIKAGLTCNVCHIKITEGTGIVPKEKCFFCHVERTEKYNDVRFVHEKHVAEKQIDCLFCHPRIIHGNIKMVSKIPSL